MHLKIFAVILEIVDFGKVAADLPESPRGIFVIQDGSHIVGALLQLVVFGCIHAAPQHPETCHTQQRRGGGEHGKIPEREPDSDGQGSHRASFSAVASMLEQIARTAHGADQLFAKRRVDLGAQSVHQNIERGRPNGTILAPDALDERLPGNAFAGPAHQACEQQKLTPGQVDALILAGDRVPGRIEDNIADSDPAVAFFPMAPGDGLQARNQFRKRKRFGKVVVRARVETVNDVVLRVAGGQHQHRRRARPLSQRSHQRIPIQLWQPDVQHDRVEVMRRRNLQPRLAIGCGHHGKPLFIEPLAQQLQHARLRLRR